MFDKVIELDDNYRVQEGNKEQVVFRQLLRRLRTGDSTETDWHILLSRQSSEVGNISEFSDAIRLFFGNEDVARYNHEKLTNLAQPIAQINAHHSTSHARKIDSDQICGLEPTIFLGKNASVMLTMNLWTEVGLRNGANGTVVDLIYVENTCPPDLPVAIMVHFPNYTGLVFIKDNPKLVPICPITVSAMIPGEIHDRQQLPIRLAWAITIHKSQGLTLMKAWINLGKQKTLLAFLMLQLVVYEI